MADECMVGEKSQLTLVVVRGKQKYTHLLLKNPEEREEEKTPTFMTERKYLKLFVKYIEKVDDRMHCTAYTMHT